MRRTRKNRIETPSLALVLGAVTSVQLGAALARTLFDRAGPSGTVALRTFFAAAVLVAIWPPRLRGRSRADLRLLVLYGLALAGMNGFFYEALSRVPLGPAVTFEFIGPLAVAVAGSRRALDGLWVVLAGAGVVVLAAPWSSSVDPLGVAFALIAGAFWAAYILLAARTGAAFPGGSGLAAALLVSSAVLVPIGVASAGAELFAPGVLLSGAGVALLSSAIPYALELEALRRLTPAVFGVFLSLEPAVAAVAGFVILGQSLAVHELAGIALVVAASAGAAMSPSARGDVVFSPTGP